MTDFFNVFWFMSFFKHIVRRKRRKKLRWPDREENDRQSNENKD